MIASFSPRCRPLPDRRNDSCAHYPHNDLKFCDLVKLAVDLFVAVPLPTLAAPGGSLSTSAAAEGRQSLSFALRLIDTGLHRTCETLPFALRLIDIGLHTQS